MIFSEKELAAIQAHSDVVELAEELRKKAGSANWNGMGYVREFRILAQKIEAICARRMLDLEFDNARVVDSRCSGVDLEDERTSKNSGLGQRETGSKTLPRRNASKRYRSRKKVGTVGTK